MQKSSLFIFTVFAWTISFGQKLETVYLDAKDSTANMYIAVAPQTGQVNSFLFLLDGFGNSPPDVLIQTEKRRLLQAIEGTKPFAKFKHQIENSGPERELWFAFRRKKNIEWIQEQLTETSA